MVNIIKLSVRNLVEFVLRKGDIDNSFMSMSRAVEGTLAHQKVQKSYGHEYSAEVTLKHSVYYEDFIIELQGRADGILSLGNDIIIDEIKSTTKDLELIEEDYNELHWAQAKCYGYIYSLQNNLDNISIQLTYFHIESEEKKKFIRNYSKDELEVFFLSLTDKYIKWASITFYWRKDRDISIKELQFPFGSYRKGQRELAVATYKTIEEGKNLFAEAPTGIGKTMSTLFPVIKSMGEGLVSKVFYLTAKTITREIPIASMELMMEKGLRAKTVVITAKEKICLNHEVKCNPRDCTFAKGHFDRVNDGVMDIFKNEDLITRDVAVFYARKHNICPVEFILDVCLWADIVICDYNYVFDPQVYLRRFFESPMENYVLLIDEAHNLVDRSREMFSSELKKSMFVELRSIFREDYPKIYKAINSINTILNRWKKKLEDKREYYQKEEISDLYYPIKRLITVLEPWLIEEKDNEEYDGVLNLYFSLITFNKISELYDEHYVTYIKEDRDIVLKLYCVDPSYLLRQALERGRSAIFFSATLTPLDYHMDLLGSKKGDYNIKLSSPFPRENLQLFISSTISTRYKDRERTYIDIVKSIEVFIGSRKGNYFVFFPSYKYMMNVYDLFRERNHKLNIIIQKNSMKEEEREGFLLNFDRNDDIIAFAVMGGIFSEGIDLAGEKLIGAIIVGVGLPQICLERNIIKDYFTEKIGEGYEYAYTYPGMNKVLQAAGRVIRSPFDKGSVLLIDDRYNTKEYRDLFPKEWNHSRRFILPYKIR